MAEIGFAGAVKTWGQAGMERVRITIRRSESVATEAMRTKSVLQRNEIIVQGVLGDGKILQFKTPVNVSR